MVSKKKKKEDSRFVPLLKRTGKKRERLSTKFFLVEKERAPSERKGRILTGRRLCFCPLPSGPGAASEGKKKEGVFFSQEKRFASNYFFDIGGACL